MTDREKEQVKKFRIAGLGYSEIAKHMGLSRETVKSHCRRHGIGSPKRRAEVKMADSHIMRCRTCGAEIVQIPGRKQKKYCDDKCRMKWWNSHGDYVRKKAYYRITCQHCGKAFEVYGNAGRKYCCHECYIAERFGE